MRAPYSRLDWLPEGSMAIDATGFAVAALLLLLLLALLPSGRRTLLKLPVSFLILFAILETARLFLPSHGQWVKPIHVVGVFSILLASGRGVYLLVFYSRLSGRWAQSVPTIFRDIAQVVIYLGVGMGTLRAAGVDPGSLLTTSALITAVIGLSLQETLGNLFSGLSLQAEQPFEVGDWVALDSGYLGQVIEINWRATKVLTLDRVVVTVPNGTIAKAPIRNFTKPTRISRRTIHVSAAYATPPEKVRATLLEAIKGAPSVLDTPAPTVVLKEYADSGVNYDLRYFIDDFRHSEEIDSTARERVWYAFARAGLEIPFPQRDVHVWQVTEESRAREEVARVELRGRALRFVNLFDLLSAEQRRNLAEQARTKLYAPGETIIKQGTSGAELYVVLDGEVAVLVEHEGQEPGEVARLSEGEYFGEMSLLTGQARTATVRAVTSCEVLVVGHEPFKVVLAARPELVERMSKLLAQRKLELEQRNSFETERQRAYRADQTSKEILVRIRTFFKL